MEKIVELEMKANKKDVFILKLIGIVRKMNIVVKRKYWLVNYLLERIKLPNVITIEFKTSIIMFYLLCFSKFIDFVFEISL